MVTTKVTLPNTITATAMSVALGTTQATKIVKEVRRGELVTVRDFNKAVSKTRNGALNFLRGQCVTARSKSTTTKVINAQEALLEFLIQNRDVKSDPLTKAEWLLVSDHYYNLHLDGCKLASLGRTPGVWSTASEIWDYVYSLEQKHSYQNNNH